MMQVHQQKNMYMMLPYHSYPHLMLMISITMLLLSLFLNAFNITLMMEWTIMNINSSNLYLPIMLDPMGTLFMSTVTFISFNVLTFSKSYMMGDPNLTRFTHILSLFIMSMLLLIMSPNIITMMLGWDGLGLTSFLLVIYYQNTSSLKGGMITALTNRIGDALLLIAIGLIVSQGHWNMMNMWEEMMNNSTTSIMILLAAMTKSAQFPFVAWLPEAMAAPTPVSALVHSSTLVTAGVYIVIRLYPFLSQTKMFNSILLTSGLITSAAGAWWATAYSDQKKTVALSTLSQLGLMMTSLGLNMVTLCFVHMLTHAMFKATLFMSLGTFIMMKHHRQRKENLRMHTYFPVVSAAAGLSLLSMCGFFFMAGFYSKEIILETSVYNPWSWVVFIMMAISAYGTVMYSVPLWRVLVISPMSQKQYPFEIHTTAKEWYINSNNTTLIVPMTLMSVGTICMGSIVFWMFIPPSELPILPTYLHLSPFIWPSLGVLTAINSCRMTTKISSPTSAINELRLRMVIKSKKFCEMFDQELHNQLPPMTKFFSFLTITKARYVLKMNKNIMKTQTSQKPLSLMKKILKKIFPNNEIKSHMCKNHLFHLGLFIPEGKSFVITRPQRMQRLMENMNGILMLSFNTATPFMSISLSTLKALDQGFTTLLSAEGFKSMFPNASSLILLHQSNHITKSILLFMALIFMLLPLFI